jgi:hypothetical protein
MSGVISLPTLHVTARGEMERMGALKRGTLFRSAVDVLKRAGAPMTAREITDAMIAGKGVTATPKQVRDLQGGVTAQYRGS